MTVGDFTFLISLFAQSKVWSQQITQSKTVDRDQS